MFKLSKGKMDIILVLCLISLVSIGFSSWNIQSLEVKNEGGFMVDDVESGGATNKYINMKNDPQLFEYTEDGFSQAHCFIVDKTHFKVVYTIDIAACKQDFSGKSNLYVETMISYDASYSGSLNIFATETENESGYHYMSHSIGLEGQSTYAASNMIASTASITEVRYIAPITFNGLLNTSLTTLDFYIDYQIYATHGSYFTSNIYPELLDMKFQFGISAQGK